MSRKTTVIRPEISEATFQKTLKEVEKALKAAIKKKGSGALVSWHEAQGNLNEEVLEFEIEVQKNSKERKSELIDVVVAALFGLASHNEGVF